MGLHGLLQGELYFTYLPVGTTVNQTLYVQVLKRLSDAVRRKRGELWRDNSLFLHHDNAATLSSLRVSQL
jgi:hypothetical protein